MYLHPDMCWWWHFCGTPTSATCTVIVYLLRGVISLKQIMKSCNLYVSGGYMYPLWPRLQWRCGGPAPVGRLCQHEGVALWNHAALRRNHLLLQHQHKRMGCQVSVAPGTPEVLLACIQSVDVKVKYSPGRDQWGRRQFHQDSDGADIVGEV